MMTKAKIHWKAMTLVASCERPRAAMVSDVCQEDLRIRIRLTERQNGKSNTHGPVLERNQEEATQNHDAPNDDVGQDASWQVVGVHRSSTVPENGYIIPGIRE